MSDQSYSPQIPDGHELRNGIIAPKGERVEQPSRRLSGQPCGSDPAGEKALQLFSEAFAWIRWLAQEARPPELRGGTGDESDYHDGLYRIPVESYRQFGKEMAAIERRVTTLRALGTAPSQEETSRKEFIGPNRWEEARDWTWLEAGRGKLVSAHHEAERRILVVVSGLPHPEPAGDRRTPSEAGRQAARKAAQAVIDDYRNEDRWPQHNDVIDAAIDALFAVDFPSGESRRDPEELAQQFHETYERLAPSFGYETRRESAKPWSQVPEQNRRLMAAVCAEILRAGDGRPPDEEGAK